MDPVRGSAQFVVRVFEVGTAPVRGLARLGSDSLLAALLALLGGTEHEETPDVLPDALAGAAEVVEDEEPPAAEVITRGLLAGHGRFTRLEVAARAGISIEECASAVAGAGVSRGR